jgi:hypothetical protein
MKKYLRLVGKGLKYSAGLFVGTGVLGLGYLRYINSQLGPIEIDKDGFTKHYIQEVKLNPMEATKMYYWALFDIAFMRICTYRTYVSYCDKLNRRILAPALQRYTENGLLNRI